MKRNFETDVVASSTSWEAWAEDTSLCILLGTIKLKGQSLIEELFNKAVDHDPGLEDFSWSFSSETSPPSGMTLNDAMWSLLKDKLRIAGSNRYPQT